MSAGLPFSVPVGGKGEIAFPNAPLSPPSQAAVGRVAKVSGIAPPHRGVWSMWGGKGGIASPPYAPREHRPSDLLGASPSGARGPHPPYYPLRNIVPAFSWERRLMESPKAACTRRLLAKVARKSIASGCCSVTEPESMARHTPRVDSRRLSQSSRGIVPPPRPLYDEMTLGREFGGHGGERFWEAESEAVRGDARAAACH